MEKTLSIIKPDGTKKNKIGYILNKFEEAGLRVAACKKIALSKNQAEGFYYEHRERGFFGELVEFMTSGPDVVSVLEGEGAVGKNREIMGATNPAEADEGTIRRELADSIGENTVHGSDSQESAKREIAFFFSESEIV